MRTCIITGASSGIGQATAVQLGLSGEFAHITLIGTNEARLAETQNMLGDSVRTDIIPYNLLDLDGIPDLVQSIHQKMGRIDCLLNIAGYTDPQPILTTTIENLQMTYTVNVFAPLVLIRECVKYMKQERNNCKILNVASTAGITPRPGWISYSSSKAAVVAMSETLSEELAEYGIRIYCVSPGRCATDLRRKLAPNEDQSKIMQPKEVGEIICRLISLDEHCMDGQNIIIRKREL